jgi:hypothetical protein
MTNKGGTMDLQWGETGAGVLGRRAAASAERIQREQEIKRPGGKSVIIKYTHLH